MTSACPWVVPAAPLPAFHQGSATGRRRRWKHELALAANSNRRAGSESPNIDLPRPSCHFCSGFTRRGQMTSPGLLLTLGACVPCFHRGSQICGCARMEGWGLGGGCSPAGKRGFWEVMCYAPAAWAEGLFPKWFWTSTALKAIECNLVPAPPHTDTHPQFLSCLPRGGLVLHAGYRPSRPMIFCSLLGHTVLEAVEDLDSTQ